MISAAAAETHTFARVRRNGYDPHEVDAIVARLIDDLRRAQAAIDEFTRHGPPPEPVPHVDPTMTEPPEIRHLLDALS